MEGGKRHILETEQVEIKDEAVETVYLSEIKSEPQDNIDYEMNDYYETYKSTVPIQCFKSDNEVSIGSLKNRMIVDDHIIQLQENIHEVDNQILSSSESEYGNVKTIPRNYCHECNKEFRTDSALVSHMKIHLLDDDENNDDKQFDCSICNKTFKTENDYVIHRDTHFRNVYECEVCDFKTQNCYEKYLHKQKHLNSDILFECDLCKYQTTNVRARDEHIEMHESNKSVINEKDLLYQCRLCNYQTRDVNVKNIHLKEHDQKNKIELVASKTANVLYKCYKCNFQTVNKKEKEVHQKSVHKIKTFSCSVYQCVICFQRFPDMEQFLNHIKEIHSKLKCRECGQILSKKSHMLFHKISHIGEFSNTCSVCGSQFSLHSLLEIHENIHKAKLNCKCDVCGKQFVLPSEMFAHRKFHHSEKNMLKRAREDAASVKRHYGKEGYFCKQCHTNYGNIVEYTKHKIIHWKSNEFKMKCNICNKDFQTITQLVNHRKFHPQMIIT